MTTEEDSLNELPSEYQYSSYASAAAVVSAASVDSTQISSPTASTQTEWRKQNAELETLIRQQAAQIAKIQADLESKVNRSPDLEDKLAQAIEMAHNRDERHEELLRKFETLMANINNDPQTTPPRIQPASEPPPSKKANTNMSPQRQIYALFRPPTQKMVKSSLASRQKSPQKLLTQPMDTDDDTLPPKPGAKPGKKTE